MSHQFIKSVQRTLDTLIIKGNLIILCKVFPLVQIDKLQYYCDLSKKHPSKIIEMKNIPRSLLFTFPHLSCQVLIYIINIYERPFKCIAKVALFSLRRTSFYIIQINLFVSFTKWFTFGSISLSISGVQIDSY